MQVHLLSLIHFRTAHLFPSSWSFYQCNIMQLLPRGHSVSSVKLLSTFSFWNSKYSVTASKQQTNQEDWNDKMCVQNVWCWKVIFGFGKKKKETLQHWVCGVFENSPHSSGSRVHWQRRRCRRRRAEWGTALCLGRHHHLGPGTERLSRSLREGGRGS